MPENVPRFVAQNMSLPVSQQDKHLALVGNIHIQFLVCQQSHNKRHNNPRDSTNCSDDDNDDDDNSNNNNNNNSVSY